MLDANTLLVGAIASIPGWIVAADRVIPAARRLLRLPSEVRAADIERARAIVARDNEERALSDIADEREAILGLTAIATELQAVPAQVAEILAEMRTNSGHSLRDAVNSTKTRSDETADLMAQHIEEAEGDRRQLARMESRLEAGQHEFAAIRGRLDSIEAKVGEPA